MFITRRNVPGSAKTPSGFFMAYQSPKPCVHPACPALVYNGAGWCAKHLKTEGRFSDRYRGSRHQRGYGSAWQRLRKRIMERDNYLCQVCLQTGRISSADAVDHIVAKAFGGDDNPENLQAICNSCHKTKTAQEGRGTQKLRN